MQLENPYRPLSITYCLLFFYKINTIVNVIYCIESILILLLMLNILIERERVVRERDRERGN